MTDRYRLEERLATGGMGEVWRGHDTVLDRPVAVKVLRSEYADDPGFRERFAAEARNAAALHHPGIAGVFDFDADRGRLVMELVEGRPLSALIRSGEPMDPASARDLVAQVAEGISAAHAVGTVHRDLKPANLLVTTDGQVKITDFGIARAAESVTLSRPGEMVGTPQYLSPEQVRGEPVSPASDVYALGVVLVELLTGRRPFQAETSMATALAHLHQPVPELPDAVPADLRSIARRALAKEPGERFPDGAALARALGSADLTSAPTPTLVAQAPAPAPAPATRVLTAGPESRRGGVAWPLVAGAAAAAVVVGLLVWSPWRGTTTAPTGSSSPSATAGPRTATVRAADFRGLEDDQARARARDLGFTSLRVDRVPNTGDGDPGEIADVRPTGEVPLDRTLVLEVWASPPQTPEPSTATKPEKRDQHGGKKKKDDDKGHGKKGTS